MAFPSNARARTRVRKTDIRAGGVCDRCFFRYNLTDLHWQHDYRGNQLQDLRLRVCSECLDVPQAQLRSPVLPPDPVPVPNPRLPGAVIPIITTLSLLTQDGRNILTESLLLLRVSFQPLPESWWYPPGAMAPTLSPPERGLAVFGDADGPGIAAEDGTVIAADGGYSPLLPEA